MLKPNAHLLLLVVVFKKRAFKIQMSRIPKRGGESSVEDVTTDA